MVTRRLFRYASIGFDLGALAVAWLFAARFRTWSPGLTLAAHDGAWIPPVLALLLLWLPATPWLRFSIYQQRFRLSSTLVRALECSVLATAIALFTSAAAGVLGHDVSRRFALLFAPSCMISFVAAQVTFSLLAGVARGRWKTSVQMAVIGNGLQVGELVKRIQSENTLLHFRGIIVPGDGSNDGPHPSWPVLGTTDNLAQVINREHIEHVVLLNSCLDASEVEVCSRISKRMGVQVSCALATEVENEKITVSTHYGVPLVEYIPRSETIDRVKRLIDAMIAAFTLALLSPIFLAIAVAIRMTSEGRVLYCSARVGKGGRHFTFLKFRSMYTNTSRAMVAAANEKDGHIFKVKDDPRVTPVGRFIRRYSLDELPQLINVLLGDMSLVGPRPLPAEDLDPDGMSREFGFWAEQRGRVRPGITGLWQIHGRSELPFEDLIRYDLEYVRNQSLLLDLKILLATPATVLKAEGAY